MQKFHFKSKKKNRLNLIQDRNDILNGESIKGAHIEIFSNQRIVLEGCNNIIDYQENYIKLKLKKGFLILVGSNFLISTFDEEKIDIKGLIISIEFCV